METLAKLISRLNRERRFKAAREQHKRLVSQLTRQGRSQMWAEKRAWQDIAKEFPPIQPAVTIAAIKDCAPVYLPDRKRMEIAWAMLNALRTVAIRHAPHYEQSPQLLSALAATDIRRRLESYVRPAASPPELREALKFALLVDPLAALEEVTAMLTILAEQCSRRSGKHAERTEEEAAMILHELPLLQAEAPPAAATYGKALLKQFDRRIRTQKGAPSDCQKTRNQIGLTPGGTP